MSSELERIVGGGDVDMKYLEAVKTMDPNFTLSSNMRNKLVKEYNRLQAIQTTRTRSSAGIASQERARIMFEEARSQPVITFDSNEASANTSTQLKTAPSFDSIYERMENRMENRVDSMVESKLRSYDISTKGFVTGHLNWEIHISACECYF